MTISENLREAVRQVSGNRCGYCRIHARYVYAPMEIDHIVPKSRGGTDEPENLWLACPRCNNYKSDQTVYIDPKTNIEVELFNPRLHEWSDHFMWSENGIHIIGKSPCGQGTIIALQLNNEQAVEFRRLLISAGWHPPTDE